MVFEDINIPNWLIFVMFAVCFTIMVMVWLVVKPLQSEDAGTHYLAKYAEDNEACAKALKDTCKIDKSEIVDLNEKAVTVLVMSAVFVVIFLGIMVSRGMLTWMVSGPRAVVQYFRAKRADASI